MAAALFLLTILTALPPDIPLYPDATLDATRHGDSIDIFEFRARAGPAQIDSFYREQLAARQWTQQIEGSNSTNGLLFRKGARSLRVVAVQISDTQSEIHLLVGRPSPAVGSRKGPRLLGNLFDHVQYLTSIPADVPLYENARQTETVNPEKWREFVSPDSVPAIASWYADRMKANGWTVHLDNSEHGDSMVVYSKGGADKVPRFIGIRINDRGDHRNLTIILYPKGVVVPRLAPGTPARSRS